MIEAMSLTSRCLSLDDTGAFATNNPFGSVPFCSGIAAEAGSPSVRADTSPQCATVRCAAVIIGLLVFASGGRPACAHCSNPNPIRAPAGDDRHKTAGRVLPARNTVPPLRYAVHTSTSRATSRTGAADRGEGHGFHG